MTVLKEMFFPLQEANRLENLCCQCYSAEVRNGDGIPSLSYDFTTWFPTRGHHPL